MTDKNYYESNQDIDFIVECIINWDSFIPKLELDFKDAKLNQENPDTLAPSSTEEAIELYKEAFRQYGELCVKEIAPVSSKLDKEGLKFDKGKVIFPKEVSRIVDIIANSDLLCLSISRKYGGLNFPLVAQSIIYEMLARADASISVTLGCFNIANMIERYGSKEIKDKYLNKITSGKYIPAMALTEPNYGSDLPHIQTTAIKINDSEYQYEITGSKRYITHGCGVDEKSALILTLARSSGSGARGLSFFLVESNNIEVGGIEKKVGLHLSPTCEVIYSKSKATLIGETKKGLVKYAMEMMNGARMMVASQSLGIAVSAHHEAVKYASERIQFGRTIEKIPAIRRILDEIQANIHAMRALIYQTSEIVDLFESEKIFRANKGIGEKEIQKDPEIKKWNKLSKLFTPISKYFCSETANRIVYNATQVFGGAGFIEDYPIGQLYRDVRITTIYEGTSQLQVVASIGGIVEGMQSNTILDKFLKEKISFIRDNNKKAELQIFQKELKNLISSYKKKEKETKETLASDLVDYFCVFFSLLILTKHKEIAETKNHPILSEKKKAYEVFYIMAKKIMETSKIQLSLS